MSAHLTIAMHHFFVTIRAKLYFLGNEAIIFSTTAADV